MFRFFAWSIRWSLATAFFLIVMAAAGLYVFHSSVSGGKYVEVPNISQMSITQASSELGKEGLIMGKHTPMFSEQIPEYHVISQRPGPGATVRAGREVFPTVSQGAEILSTPDFTGKTLSEIESGPIQNIRFGAKAYIYSSIPRDNIIAQDPPPSRPLRVGDDVCLLISRGVKGDSFAMPNLVGRPLENALRLLGPMKVHAIANRVDNLTAPANTILDQTPAPGAMLREGDTVTYDIRASGSISLPNARRKINIAFEVPKNGAASDVQIDLVDAEGNRQTVLPSKHQLAMGERPRYQPGTMIRLPQVSFQGELTVEIFVNGQKARTYFYQGDEPPQITDYRANDETQEGNDIV